MRKTKIVCTIGPASSSEEILKGLCKAGMNVARLNFSHNTHEDHQERIDLIKKVRNELNMPIAIMLDTKGPEYRIKTFKEHKITLNDGDKFTFTTDDIEGNEARVAVSYKNLPAELNIGDTILLNNGLLTFKVEKIDGADIECITVLERKVIARDTAGNHYRIQDRLRELEDVLPSYFIRINKSTLANEDRISRFEAVFSGGVDAVFRCGYREYVSRRCFSEIKRRYEKK